MSETTPSTPTPGTWWLLRRIGPGLVTACVVIGPGSILTSSQVGARNGYSLVWVVVAACVFMLVYTTLAARLGVVARESTCNLIVQRLGRPLAALIGFSVFFISAAFQFGNNLGVDSAFRTYVPERYKTPAEPTDAPSASTETDVDGTATTATPRPFNPFDYTVVAFNALSLGFLFGFKNLYRQIERLMTVFVGVMLCAFAVNLFFAHPNVPELAAGFVPAWSGERGVDLSVLGLVGTTFVITAAFYQSYLVRFKGWTTADLKEGMVDARISACIMALITLMLMCTAGAVLRGQTLGSVSDVAESLRPLFGEKGRILFCVGLFSAAYSSFLVNSMIGGFILSDSLGLGSTPQDRWPRLLTAAVLLIGMGVALYAINSGTKPVAAIVAAQAVTVVAAPLVAGTLWWITNRPDVMGEHRNGPVLNVLAGVGFLLLLGMAYYTAVEKVWPTVRDALT